MRQRSSRDVYKMNQLCRQVERRLSLVFSGELEDRELEGLMVVGVTPLDGTALLRVEVALMGEDGEGRDAVRLLSRLAAATPWLRSEIAREIHRKRTPQLTFALTEGFGEGEGDEAQL